MGVKPEALCTLARMKALGHGRGAPFALGFRVKSGRTDHAVAQSAATPVAPVPLARIVVALSDPNVKGTRQPFHASSCRAETSQKCTAGDDRRALRASIDPRAPERRAARRRAMLRRGPRGWQRDRSGHGRQPARPRARQRGTAVSHGCRGGVAPARHRLRRRRRTWR